MALHSLLVVAAFARAAAFAADAPLEVQGHRGARAIVSENTLAAFEYAWRECAGAIEMDLAVTRDGKLVISHEPRINPELCLNADGSRVPPEAAPYIHELDLAKVRTFDCGSIKNPRFPGQRPASDREHGRTTPLPTLDEVFDLVKRLERDPRSPPRPPLRFNIETKSYLPRTGGNHPIDPTAFARLWLATVREHGMLGRSILESFDYRTLIAAKAIEPKVVIAALSEDPDENLVATAKRLGAEIISPQWDMPNVNAETVRKLHAMKVQVLPWTPNTEDAWERLAKLGVDGIITDDPARLLAFLKSRAH
jgi:glycerophosphoryl diester phosphodiesterase